MEILRNVGLCVLFGLLGIAMMAIGYKIFDWIIPLDFNKELEKNNVSVAIVIAAVIVGVALLLGMVFIG